MVQPFADFLLAIGIDLDGFHQFLCRSGHFAENQHAGVVLFDGQVFFCNEIHTVPERCDEGDIGNVV